MTLRFIRELHCYNNISSLELTTFITYVALNMSEIISDIPVKEYLSLRGLNRNILNSISLNNLFFSVLSDYIVSHSIVQSC